MENKRYKNYLEHEIKVKYVDGVLNRHQGWQWFINYIEENYDLSDINDYSEFESRQNFLTQILDKFVNILDITDSEFFFTKDLLSEIYYIARYYVGALERRKCEIKIETTFGKILFMSVWLTKLYNAENDPKYINNSGFLKLRNFHQGINMNSFDYDKEEIILYSEQINLDGFCQAKQNIKDNLNKVIYGVTEGFFDRYGDELLNVNCFNYHLIDRETNLTWQEHTLLDMLKIAINDGKVSPIYSNGNDRNPDYLSWDSQLLNTIKIYFENSISDFIIESIDFLVNENIPSLKTIETHCRLLTELIEAEENYEIYTSSTYKILDLLRQKGVMDTIEKTDPVKKLYQTIHSISSIDILLKLRFSFSLNRSQLKFVKDYIETQYKSITLIKGVSSLVEYIENGDIARHINQRYYDKTKNKFIKMIEESGDLSVSTLFYKAMLFLLNVNQTNQYVDKRIVKNDMIDLQEHWEENVYKEQKKQLIKSSINGKIASEELESFNNNIMLNPIVLANRCINSKVDDMISVMESISENPLIYMVTRMTLSPLFPIENTKINFDRNETENILKTQVEEIIKENGYRFINILDAEVYVSAFHEQYMHLATFYSSIFNMEKKLYANLEEMIEVPLIEFNENISLGHLTQLFPLLEIEIRNLGKMIGIVPFKENKDEFMKFKDPSSILRELIVNTYKELDSLENVPDLLFVYHFMYNGNSFNIRNECIHGRDYIEGNRLVFGFKMTLLAIYMIRYRINLIQSNLSESKET